MRTRKPATQAQRDYIAKLSAKVAELDATHRNHGLSYGTRLQYGYNWAREMTAAYASQCIDALKERISTLEGS